MPGGTSLSAFPCGLALALVAVSADLQGDEEWLSSVRKGPDGDPMKSRGCSVGGGTTIWSGKAGSNRYEGLVPITIMDYVPVNRSFWIQVPDDVGTKKIPAPLLVVLHGQGGNAQTTAQVHSYGSMGSLLGYVSVYPQGIDDAVPGGKDMGTGWNVGTAGDEQTCVPDIVGIFADCYASCRALGRCGDCNWSGCFDEKLFVRSVIQAISDVLCIDLTRVYLTGESNGGMLTHYLAQEMPGYFAAVAPWYGLPLLGYALGASFNLVRDFRDSQQTAMLQLHARQDQIIPIGGGISGGVLPGWIYEPLNKVQQGWAAIHHCNTEATPVTTYWDGGASKFACLEYAGCTTGRRIMRCLYDGGHGDWPGKGAGDQITIWFLLQFRLGTAKAYALVV
jgi:polyhydroxybutyrate depolymerase